MAPELLSHGKYDESADVYRYFSIPTQFNNFSFAILVYFVITEKEPYCEFETMWSTNFFVFSWLILLKK